MQTHIFFLLMTLYLSATAAGFAINRGLPEDGLSTQRRSSVVVDVVRPIIDRRSIVEDAPASVVKHEFRAIKDEATKSKDDASASFQDPTNLVKTRGQRHGGGYGRKRSDDLEQRAERHGSGYGKRSDDLETRAQRHGGGYGKRTEYLEERAQRHGGGYNKRSDDLEVRGERDGDGYVK